MYRKIIYNYKKNSVYIYKSPAVSLRKLGFINRSECPDRFKKVREACSENIANVHRKRTARCQVMTKTVLGRSECSTLSGDLVGRHSIVRIRPTIIQWTRMPICVFSSPKFEGLCFKLATPSPFPLHSLA